MHASNDGTTPERPDPDGFHDADDAPELSDEAFGRLDLYRDGRLVRLGELTPEEQARWAFLEPDVLQALRETGPGWRERVSDFLRAGLRAREAA